MLEEAFWSPAHRKIIFGKYLQQKQKSGPSGRSLQRGEGGRDLSGKAMQGTALTYARTDRLKKSTSLEEG
jgi:hypothetical protein